MATPSLSAVQPPAAEYDVEEAKRRAEEVHRLWDLKALTATLLEGWQAQPGETEADSLRRRVVRLIDEGLARVIAAT